MEIDVIASNCIPTVPVTKKRQLYFQIIGSGINFNNGDPFLFLNLLNDIKIRTTPSVLCQWNHRI